MRPGHENYVNGTNRASRGLTGREVEFLRHWRDIEDDGVEPTLAMLANLMRCHRKTVWAYREAALDLGAMVGNGRTVTVTEHGRKLLAGEA